MPVARGGNVSFVYNFVATGACTGGQPPEFIPGTPLIDTHQQYGTDIFAQLTAVFEGNLNPGFITYDMTFLANLEGRYLGRNVQLEFSLSLGTSDPTFERDPSMLGSGLFTDKALKQYPFEIDAFAEVSAGTLIWYSNKIAINPLKPITKLELTFSALFATCARPKMIITSSALFISMTIV